MPRLTEVRRVEGGRLFPPTLPLDGLRTQILIVNGVVSPEEASAVTVTEHNFEIPKKPRLGAGPIWTIIKDCIDLFPNLHSAPASFVSLVPWLLGKNYVLLVDTSAMSKRRRIVAWPTQRSSPSVPPCSPPNGKSSTCSTNNSKQPPIRA